MATRGRKTQHDVDVKHITAPVIKIVGGIVGLIFLVAAAAGGYYGLISKMDKFEFQQNVQTKTLESLAISIKQIAENAITQSDLTSACMQMQIANQRLKWICPFSGVVARTEGSEPWVPSSIKSRPKATGWSIFSGN